MTLTSALRSEASTQIVKYVEQPSSVRRISPTQMVRLCLVPLVAFLPAPLAYGFAVLRADLRYRFDESSREEIRNSLKSAFGNQLSPDELSRVARDFFRVRYCEIIDMMRLAGNGRALTRLVKIRGMEHLKAALAAGKGTILCSAHFGSFNCCFLVLGSLGLPVNLISRWSYDDDHLSPTHRLFNRLNLIQPVTNHLHRPIIVRRRGKFGVAVQAAMMLQKNELVGNMLDHSDVGDPIAPTDSAPPITVDFLNRKVTLLPGAITIAQLTGARVLMVLLRRSADWRHQVLEISPPISTEGDTRDIFRRCLAVVETAIRRNPAHWNGWELKRMVSMGLLSPEERTRFQEGLRRTTRLVQLIQDDHL